MLVLTRKKNESILIGDKIEITVLEVMNDQVRIGINAPKEVSILRKEIYRDVEEENLKALASNKQNLENIAELIKINK